MLEKMDEFFARRVGGYDGHMMNNIEGAEEIYRLTAELLPRGGSPEILDLGCGTGLELARYFELVPDAIVVGVDLSRDMLDAMTAKYAGRNIKTLCASYFDVDLGRDAFDAAVSVESLHHFEPERKLGLYKRLHAALRPGGYFVLTDYFAPSDEAEAGYFRENARQRAEQGIPDGEFCHFDTPLTEAHETGLLLRAGFCPVEVRGRWPSTAALLARKG